MAIMRSSSGFSVQMQAKSCSRGTTLSLKLTDVQTHVNLVQHLLNYAHLVSCSSWSQVTAVERTINRLMRIICHPARHQIVILSLATTLAS